MDFVFTVQLVICFVIVYFSVYAIVDRICRCVEYCARVKAHREISEEEKKED